MSVAVHFEPHWNCALRGEVVYGRRLVEGLRARGTTVETRRLPGRYCPPEASLRDAFIAALADLPDDSWVLVPGALVPALVYAMPHHGARLRFVALTHGFAADGDGLAPAVREKLRAAERRVYPAIHRVIVSSLHGAMALATYGVLPDQIGVVVPGTDPVPQARGSDGTPSLLAVGALVERKGFAELIAALATLRDLPWTLRIVGAKNVEAETTAALETLIRDFGFAGRVELSGALGQDELRAAYDGADLFVQPSSREAGGLALAQAASHGLPSLACNGGTLQKHLDRDGVVWIRPGDRGALSRELQVFLSDSSVRRRWSAGAVQSRTGVRRWARAQEELLRELEIAESLVRMPNT